MTRGNVGVGGIRISCSISDSLLFQNKFVAVSQSVQLWSRSVLYFRSYFHIPKYNPHVLLKATKAAGLCPKTAGKHLSTHVLHLCTVKIMAAFREGRIVHAGFGYEASHEGPRRTAVRSRRVVPLRAIWNLIISTNSSRHI